MNKQGVGAPTEQETGDEVLCLNMKQVAKQLDICLAKVYDLMDEGLPTIKIGTRRLIRRAALEQWLIEREREQNSQG